ncbi:MAG TPA: tetratricopeptide repeat protein, partial [Elusimicrobiales bacterium]|nr:tetratricopeptide repeat protein [Elusimicrobiales bacterium]
YLPAINDMAFYYTYGIPNVLPPDCFAAKSWTEAAANAKYVPSMLKLGQLYEEGVCGEEPDQAQALEWYEKAALSKDPAAQYRVGMAYRRGIGASPNMDEAVKWISKAAAQKHGPALAAMGYFYKEGIGVEQDYEKALRYFKAGDINGDPEGLYAMADMYLNGLGVEQDEQRGRQLLESAGAAGYTQAYVQLGEASYGVQDYAAAKRYYQACGLQGNVYCQYKMCYMLWAAQGGHQQTEEAYAWCAAGAELGGGEAAGLFAEIANYNFLAPDALKAARVRAQGIVTAAREFLRDQENPSFAKKRRTQPQPETEQEQSEEPQE